MAETTDKRMDVRFKLEERASTAPLHWSLSKYIRWQIKWAAWRTISIWSPNLHDIDPNTLEPIPVPMFERAKWCLIYLGFALLMSSHLFMPPDEGGSIYATKFRWRLVK